MYINKIRKNYSRYIYVNNIYIIPATVNHAIDDVINAVAITP